MRHIPLRDIPLEDIEMSVRLDNILKKAGYSNLQQIDDDAVAKIKAQRGCGKRSFNELLNIIESEEDDQYTEYEQTFDENQALVNAIKNFKSAFYKLIDLGNSNGRNFK